MTFGKYPDISLARARERHSEARKLLPTGTDPMAQRKAEKATTENSFQNIASLWVNHWQYGKSPRHVDYVKRRMETDILPCLGERPIAEIEAPDLVAMTKAIDRSGARDIAKRALETTGQVFRYAIAHGYTPRNAVSAAYNHALYLDPRAKMMQSWADFLEHTLRGKLLPFRGSAA